MTAIPVPEIVTGVAKALKKISAITAFMPQFAVLKSRKIRVDISNLSAKPASGYPVKK